jgi:hypothetical protein
MLAADIVNDQQLPGMALVMTGTELFERFAQKAPVAVMVRGLIDFTFSSDFLNPLADQVRLSTYTREIEFSHLVSLLTDVVFHVHPSVRAAYRSDDTLQAVAALKSFYDKLNSSEPQIGAALVQAVAQRVQPLLASFLDSPLPSLRLLQLDGNHLAATQRRLDGLETVPSPLPGQAMVLRDYGSKLFLRVLPWADAHTNERALLAGVLDWFAANDCVLIDSSFCTEEMLRGLAARQAFYVVRHHGSVGLHPLPEEEATAEKDCGRTATGRVSERMVGYACTDLEMRCIRVQLDTPTQDGHTEVKLLTNLSAEQALGTAVADLYLKRRGIETAFQELEAALRSEVDTLAYPRAALLAFCLAVSVYNLLQVVRSRAEAAQQRKKMQELSGTLLSQEVRTYLAGVGIALEGNGRMPTPSWSLERLKAWLDEMVEQMRPGRYAKSQRGPKKPRVIPTGRGKKDHSATERILQERKKARKTP